MNGGIIKNMKKTDLIIIVIVIGILFTIFYPNFYSHGPHRRSRVAEAVNLLGGLKNPMVEYYHDQGIWPSITSVGGRTSGHYTSIIKPGGPSYLPDGTEFYWIEATMKGKLDGKKLRARYILNDGPNSFGSWDCTTEGVLEPVPDKYLPSQCR
jgi:type IV pilus assembly protein PilA